MSEPRKYKLVVGVDFEPDGDLALDSALDQVARQPVGEVHGIFVDKQNHETGTIPPSARPLIALQQLDRRCEERLEEARLRHPHFDFGRIVTHYRVGRPAMHIVRLAVDLDADGIVVGTHNRRGLRRFVLGSVSEDVVHLATCPVIVAGQDNDRRLGSDFPLAPRERGPGSRPPTTH